MKNHWPELSYIENEKSYYTFLLWTQIVGKIKVVTLPWVNHSWSTTLRVTPVGLTTMCLPFEDGNFQVDFDFVRHRVRIITDEGEEKYFDLYDGLSVSEFYENLFRSLSELGIYIKIHSSPNEVVDPVPFDEDTEHHHYDPKEIQNFHKAQLSVQSVFNQFRARFRGKNSPVHFFWGAIDLAVTRFSGRSAPPHPGGIPNLPDCITLESYDRELCSAGFWPGSESFPEAAFYSYHYPEPDGFKEALVLPSEAYYHDSLGEFLLPYEVVRQAKEPERMIMEFLTSTYEAAAQLAEWDRENLEKIQ